MKEQEYKEVGGIFYHKDTPEEVCSIISYYHKAGRNTRLRFFYGDTDTGRDWMEEYDTIGYIGRSTGPIKIPLLIHNINSSGGGGILDNCIIKITANGRTLYKNNKYHQPECTVDGCAVYVGGQIHARFTSETQASKFQQFVTGQRNSKS
jgi:hypothetical protein